MAKLFTLPPKTLKSFIFLMLLATPFATSTRILEEVSPQIPLPAVAKRVTNIPNAGPPAVAGPDTPKPVAPVVAAATTTIPATNVAPIPTTPPQTNIPDVVPPVAVATTTIPAANVAPIPTTPSQTDIPDVAPPVAAATTTIPSTNAAPIPTTTASGNTATSDHPMLSFFMHDILGASHPSGRVVTGIVASSEANNLPFSKPNNQISTINGGVPLNTINDAINNNYPFLAGLNGSPTNTLIQNNGNNVVADNNQPFVTAGQLPIGLTLQQLMFGSVTVVDNEITEGHELGTTVLGRAQGFYLTSSSDGSSHTLVVTAVFHGSEHEIIDTISFFGVHRTATPISHIAIVGGTGKYENAKGYATIETLPHEDQHTTDGLETITHFSVYITP